MNSGPVLSDTEAEPSVAAVPPRPVPMFLPACGLIVGILLDSHFEVSFAWHCVVFAAAGAALVWGRASLLSRRVAILLASCACGLALHQGAFRRAEPDHLVTALPARPELARIRGVVAAPPRLTRPPPAPFYSWASGRHSTQLLLECEQIMAAGQWRPVSGLLPVRVGEVMTRIGQGDRVEAFGRWSALKPPENPGQNDWRLWNRRRGIYGRMRCSSAEAVKVLEPAAGEGIIASLRTRSRELLLPEMRSLEDESSTLVESMVLGQRSRVSPTLNEAFSRTGTSHYLSASGLHVGMLAAFVWVVSALAGVPRRGRAALMLLVVMVYAIVAEPRAPILRAATISALFCISVLLNRAVHTLNWVAAAAFVILVFRPCDLFSAGFQLSFLVVLGIVCLSPQVMSLLRGLVPDRLTLVRRLRVTEPLPPWRRRVGSTLNGLVYALAVAVAAWCTGLLVVAWHFQQVAPWGWLNSLVLMPLAFVLMVCGFVRVIVGLVWPLASDWMGPLLDGVSGGMARLVHGLADWPGASIAVPRPPLWLIPLVAAAMIYLAWLARSRTDENRDRLQAWRLNVAVLLGLALVTLLRPVPDAPGALVVDVLSVGHGSAVMIRTPNGRTLAYDAGSTSYVDAGRSVVVPALLAGRVDAITAAIVSHLNIDHYNGMPTVLDALPTSQVLVSSYANEKARAGRSATRLLEILRDRQMPMVAVMAGDRLRLGEDVDCEILWPPDAQNGPELSTNDASVILRIAHAGRSVLLCGDIEKTAQEFLMNHPGICADVLVAPHHGKVIDSTADFLRAVSPEVVVCSSGCSQAGKPAELTSLLPDAAYFNTADHGAIRISLSQGRSWVGPITAAPADRSLRGPAE